jgi:hypothetical protein
MHRVFGEQVGIARTAHGEEEMFMSTSLATKRRPEMSSGLKGGVVIIFYLLTFLAGGFFLFVGDRLGFIVDLTAAMFYMAATVLFYGVSKGA